jgi:hypothetical protein
MVAGEGALAALELLAGRFLEFPISAHRTFPDIRVRSATLIGQKLGTKRQRGQNSFASF